MQIRLAAFSFLLAALAVAPALAEETAELRQWTDSTGNFRVEASYIGYESGAVKLQRKDGGKFEVPLKKLSFPDREYVRKQIKAAREAAKNSPDAPQPDAPAPLEAEGNPAEAAVPAANDRGLGILPLAKPRAYVHTEGEPAPKPEAAVRARYSDPAKDNAPLVEAEKQRLATAGQRHLDWEKKLGYNLVRVETHHLLVHAQLPPAEARQVGMALEALKLHLQQLTGSMLLTPLRPDQDEIIIVRGKAMYATLLKVIEQTYPDDLGENWALMPQVAGGTIKQTSFFYQPEGAQNAPPAHMAIAQSAGRSIRLATNYRAPSWFTEGYTAYCENVVLKKNLVHSISYQKKDLQLSPDWATAARQLAAAGQLKTWDIMFRVELRDFEIEHYVQSYAMAAWLMQSDPQKFQDLVQQFAAGKGSEEALQAAYGQSAEQLQVAWAKWLGAR